MSKAWAFLENHRKIRQPMNIEIDEIGNKEYTDACGIKYTLHYNPKYLAKHKLEELELRELLKNVVKIEFYSNFIIINNKTYNGWNKEMIDSLCQEIYKIPEEPYYDINDLIYE